MAQLVCEYLKHPSNIRWPKHIRQWPCTQISLHSSTRLAACTQLPCATQFKMGTTVSRRHRRKIGNKTCRIPYQRGALRCWLPHNKNGRCGAQGARTPPRVRRHRDLIKACLLALPHSCRWCTINPAGLVGRERHASAQLDPAKDPDEAMAQPAGMPAHAQRPPPGEPRQSASHTHAEHVVTVVTMLLPCHLTVCA